MKKQIIIEATDVKKTYTNEQITLDVLKSVNLKIYKGEINTILGASGSGKTTLLNVLSGLDDFNSGEIITNKKKIAKLNEKQLLKFRRDNVSFVFQTYKLIPTLSVYKNVEVAAFLSKNPLDVDQVLEEVGLGDKKQSFIHQLSGGEQQRVAIARALVKNAPILFCDEPTGALDEQNSKNILEILKRVNEKYQITIVMVTHNPSIKYMSHQTIYLNSGEIVNNEMRSSETLLTPEQLNWSL